MRIRYEVIADPAVFGDEERWVVTLNDRQLAAFDTRSAARNYAVTLARRDAQSGSNASVAVDGHKIDLDRGDS